MPSFESSNDWVPVEQIDGLYYSMTHGYWYAPTNQTIGKKGIHNFLKAQGFPTAKLPDAKKLGKLSTKFSEEFGDGSDQQIKMNEHMEADFKNLEKKDIPETEIPTDSKQENFNETLTTKPVSTKPGTKSNLEQDAKEWEKLAKQSQSVNMDDKAIAEIVIANMYSEVAEGATELASNSDIRTMWQHTRSMWPPEWKFGNFLVYHVLASLKNWKIGMAINVDKQNMTPEQLQLVAASKMDWAKKIKDDDFQKVENDVLSELPQIEAPVTVN